MTLPVPWNRSRSRNTARKTNYQNYTIMDTRYQNGLHKQIIATPKLTHIRSNKRYIAIFAGLSFSSTSLVQITVVSLANLHKRPEALARYYVSSYWQAEWVKKLRWKTIESSPPPAYMYWLYVLTEFSCIHKFLISNSNGARRVEAALSSWSDETYTRRNLSF